MKQVTMRQMLEAGVHFGHKTRSWNPKMTPYIYGIHHKLHIINLEYSLPMFKRGLQFLANTAGKGGKILFVGTKHAACNIVREEAIRCGMPYVDYRWLGGMLTNYKTIRRSIKRLQELTETIEGPRFEKLVKKEKLSIMRAKDKLSACLSGIKDMGGLPDAIFIIDVGHEKIAVQEANRLKIPVVGIVDTNGKPEGIDYMVPGNDDGARAIRLYCHAIAEAINDVRGTPEQRAAEQAAKQAAAAIKVMKKPTAKVADKAGKPAAAKAAESSAEKKAPAKIKTVKMVKKVEKEEAEKPAAKKTVGKKTTAKASTAKKTAAKKTTAKASTATKAAAKKTTAKVSTAKKTAAKKTTAKASTATKIAAKKTTAKASTAKKAPAKKTTAKKTEEKTPKDEA